MISAHLIHFREVQDRNQFIAQRTLLSEAKADFRNNVNQQPQCFTGKITAKFGQCFQHKRVHMSER